MSQEQFNDLVKRMLDFGHNTLPTEKQTEIKDNSIPLQQGKMNDIVLPPVQQESPTTTPLPRKDRRVQERVAKRLEKLKKLNARKEEISSDVKAKLEKAKEETRKSAFSDDDRTRIERVLFNKTN